MSDEFATTDAPTSDVVTSDRRVNLFGALVAPWRLVNPERAARDMALASSPAAWSALLIGVVAVEFAYLGCTFLSLWTKPHVGRYGDRTFFSAAETWGQMTDGVRPEVLVGAANLMVWIPLLSLIGGVHYLVSIHRTGGIGSSMRLGVRACASGVGFLCLIAIVGFSFQFCWSRVFDPFGLDVPPVIEAGVLITLGIIAHLWRLSRAVRAVAIYTRTSAVEPTCEGCGYNLTGQPMEGRCPECGREVRASLDSAEARPGTRWQLRPGWISWLATSREVLLRPVAHYQRVRLNGDFRGGVKYALVNDVLMGMLLSLNSILILGADAGLFDFLQWSVSIGITSGLIAHGVHRAVFSFAALFHFGRGKLTDGRRLRVVMDYESTFLWLFWLVNLPFLVIVTFWTATANFMMIWSGVNCVLLSYWFIRISRAVRAVRWSNF